MHNVYASKIDTWLLLVLAFAVVSCLVVPLLALRSQGAVAIASAVPTILIGAGLPLWLFLSTSYILTDAALLVQCGPFKWQVPLAEISAVAPTRSPLSSPALSLDRLRIDYSRGKSIMISPREKERFLQDLEQRRNKLRQQSGAV